MSAPTHDNPHAVPPGWPRAERPLTVAILGWARLSYQANQGSGYNLSASELAAGLSLMGHRVHYLASGRRYDPWPAMRIVPLERWRGVECHELLNSPNLSPASANFTNLAAEADHPGQVRLVLGWLRRVAAQVVHIHSLEGFPLSLIGAIREAGLPVVVTPHNYWYLCPQVDLLRGETTLCLDYEGGNRCVNCLRPSPAWATRLKRRAGQAIEAVLGQEPTAELRKAAKDLSASIAERTGRTPTQIPNDRDADPESALGLGSPGPLPEGHDGTIVHGLREVKPLRGRKPIPVSPHDANERMLASDRHLVVLNDYGRRRAAGVEALNRASLVIPPSGFLASVHERMGVRQDRLRVVRLGQPHFDQIHRRAKRSPFYDRVPWEARTAARPLRLGFFGAMRPGKGIDVLAAAIPMVPKELRRRCQFVIRAHGYDWPLRRPLSAFPEVSWGGAYDLLQLIGAAGDYDVGILPHVWFENSPLVLLEHLHAGKFVVSSRLGGPVEWIREGENGLMVTGGDPAALAQAIARLASGEVPVPSPRAVHEATPLLRSWPDHVREVAEVYAETIAAR